MGMESWKKGKSKGIFKWQLYSIPVEGISVKSNSPYRYTVELQWLEHLSDHENMFETGVVQANAC